MRNWIGLVVGVLMFGGVLVDAVAAAPGYRAGWDAEWLHRVERDVCTLSQTVVEYGEARFRAARGDAPSFEFQARRDLQASPMQLYRVAPDWHRDPQGNKHLGEGLHVAGGGTLVRGPIAEAMLLALRQGYEIELQASTSIPGEQGLSWRLTALGFYPAYDAFLACSRTKVSVAWHELSRTRIAYAVDEHKLDDDQKAQLEKVAQFVTHDPTVTSVFVDGHTDATGTTRANGLLAKRRAEAVAKHLTALGLSKEKVIVRYHGSRYPVADNDSPEGRAQNRRTTIRLSQEDSQQVAATSP